MYTNKSIRLHSRCLEVLEMIQKINYRIDEKKLTLVRYDSSKWYDSIQVCNNREFLVTRIATDKAIRQRLVNRYVALMSTAVEESIKRCYPIETKQDRKVLLITSGTY